MYCCCYQWYYCVGGSLSEEELREAQRAASNEIICRYERNQKSLLVSLEQERMRQRRKIADALAAKKNRNNVSQHAALDEEAEKAIKDLESSFQIQQAEAISGPQDNAMYALSAVYTPDDLMQSETGMYCIMYVDLK